jgi:hypothetical protein
MAKSVLVRVSLVRAALLGATALSLFSAPFTIGDAAAKVGVTSATDGDPLGKPPQEAERVLRIGIDVQANELITTNANDRAHLVFLDGSSLTVGPNAQLTIDKFVFDPSTKTGELAINASKGVLRLVGGKISKSNAITITTPSSTIGIRGGITIMDVSASKTDSAFVFGKDMTVRGAGQTQVATRPGSMIVTNVGRPPGMPTLLAQGALNGQLGALEGRRSAQSSGGGSSSGARNADQTAQTSGLSGVNSGQAPLRIVTTGTPDKFGSGPGPRNLNPNETVASAITNSLELVQQTAAVTQFQQQQQATTDTTPLSTTPLQPFIDLPPNPDIPEPKNPITPQIDLSKLNEQRAVATYVGDVSALVRNGRSVYFAHGTYQNIWSFGNRSGVATIQVDKTTYGGGNTPNTFAAGKNGAAFHNNAPLASTSGPQDRRITHLNGHFTSKSGPASNQQGGIILDGRNYEGVGVFNAKK